MVMDIKLFDRPIAFHRCFVDLTGSVKAALLLSQGCYWALRSKGGRFYKSMAEWKDETGLSRKEQDGARATLRRFSFWREEVRKIEHRVYYTVDMAGVAQAVEREMTMPERGIEDVQKGQCTMPERDNVKEQRLPETTYPSVQRSERPAIAHLGTGESGSRLFVQVRSWAEQSWRERFGSRPTWAKKDFVGIARVLRLHPELGLGEFKARWGRFLADSDSFVARQGHSLALFCSRFDSYIDRSASDIPLATAYEDHWPDRAGV